MKKLIIILLLFLGYNVVAQENEPKKRAIKNGISFNTSIGIKQTDVGLQLPSYNWDEYCYIQFQFGTRWYIKPREKWALGIKTCWFDVSITTSTAFKSENTHNYPNNPWDEQINKKLTSFSFLTVGPIATYAFTDDIATDLYYNLRPTFVLAETSVNNIGSQPGIGISHVLGGAIRIGVLNVGAEYVYGEIKPINDKIADAVEDIDNSDLSSHKIGGISTQYFRIVLGCKF